MNNYILVNADTDSVMISKPDQSPWTKEEQNLFLKKLNEQFPEKISFEHDGLYKAVVVIKSKNYALLSENENKAKLKGSGIKDQKKEPALKEMMSRIIDVLLFDGLNNDKILKIYHEYIKEALNPKDVFRWCQKKTVSESVMNCRGYEDLAEDDEDSPRKNETDIWNTIKNEEGVQQGDKIYVYPKYMGKAIKKVEKFKKNKETGLKESQGFFDIEYDLYGLKLAKYYENDIASDKLVKRVYDTINIFSLVLDMAIFPKYHLKGNKEELEKLKNE